MNIPFYKYQGTGNDFIMIDNRAAIFEQNIELITQMCDRKFGIGADGLILIENHEALDFEMIYFNADGSQSLCGNGSRCAVSFAKFLGIIGNTTKFLTIDGTYEAEVVNDIVHLHMRDQRQPVQTDTHYFLNNGSPHHMEIVSNADQEEVKTKGASIRYSEVYHPNGTNVNFVEISDQSHIYVRTYERGVEDETLSCGTGVTASALVAGILGHQSPISIKTKGGDLEVKFDTDRDGNFVDIWLIGPARQVYSGRFDR